ncbi:MAG: hypothetical protein ISS69_07840 [Phycisphaerae bacterium]|nr:hypothetical protein [Planctomycetota bacterium]MBL7220009.1 hypothetical protein [Phycisphaerae bacterium]
MTDLTGKRATMLKNLLVGIAVVSAAVSGGCATVTNTGPSAARRPAPEPHADRIGLMVPQKAIVNWDGEPGFDGAIAQVMLFKNTAGGPKSILVSGEVDVMMYEGAKPDDYSNVTKPFFSWTFTPAELAQRVVGQYGALWGYALVLEWTVPPKSEKVWMIARYRPPSGSAIYSSPAEQVMPVEMPGAKK